MREMFIDNYKFQPKPKEMSQFRKVGPFVFIGGKVGQKSNGEIVSDPEEQILLAFKHLDEALKAAGATRDNVVKLNHYVVDRQYLPTVVRTRKEFFQSPYPASTGIICELAQPDFIYEVEAIAIIDEK